MAANPLPNAANSLFTLAEDMADGAHTYETSIGLKQNKEADIRADLAAARTAQDAVDAAKLGKKNAGTAQTVADSNGKAFIALAKNALSPVLGSAWSQAWIAVGFPSGSLAIPGIIAERQELLHKITDYLTANPAREIAQINFTAAAAGTAFNALSDARSAFNQSTTALSQAINTRDDAEAALRTRMRGLIDELEQVLGDADPLWYAFGLNAPADPATPGIPDGLVLTPGPAGTIYADWADARRAESYHVYGELPGGHPNRLATVTDSDATLTGLPSGGIFKITITAVNAAGESQPCAEVVITVP